MINLDHAATTPLKPEVLEAMIPYFCDIYANASAGYGTARKSRQAVEQARRKVADSIGAKPSEIYFTSGGTEADNWALMGTARARKDKRHIITSGIEHHAVLRAAQSLENEGYEVTYLSPDEKGRISPQSVLNAIRPDTALISVMLANNEVGTIEPVAQIAEIARAHHVTMHTDAVQAAGHIPIDVNILGVDLLTMSAHKFYGPKGIGALYIRTDTRIDRMLFGGEQERGMRPGTENVPAIVGMGKAAELACASLQQHASRVSMLRGRLERKLLSLPGVRSNGDPDNRLPGHLHVTIDGCSSQLLLAKLDMAGIAASAGSACSSGSLSRSHVIESMGIAGENQADIRFTIGECNTIEEIDQVADMMSRILAKR